MKIDKYIDRKKFNDSQFFFIECWFNLSHTHAIDSERVNYLNTLNGINELITLYNMGNNHNAPRKRFYLVKELLIILKSDEVLKERQFSALSSKIIDIFESVDFEENKHFKKESVTSIESQRNLIISLIKELTLNLKSNYREVAIDKIINLINSDPLATIDSKNRLYSLSNFLMSFLMTEGMSLAELFGLYKNVIINERVDSDFFKRLELLKHEITKDPKTYRLQLKFFSRKLYDLIKRKKLSKVEVSSCSISPDLTNENFLFADLSVYGISVMSARKKAEEIIREIMDCFTYVLERDYFTFEPTFSVLNSDGSIKKTLMFIERISNDGDAFNDEIFLSYNTILDKMLNNSELTELRIKLLSSFRLYYNGITSFSSESKFTSLWSSLEALTQGASSEKLAHDAHVLHVVLPNIGVNYISKRLTSFKKLFKTLGVKQVAFSGQVINLITVTNKELYLLFKQAAFVSAIEIIISDHLYVIFKLNKFYDSIKDCESLYESLIRHEEKVMFHISRLYMARNAITHNASSFPALDLLSLNLQHYLRSCINSVFDMMGRCPTVNNVSEAFLRFNYEKEISMKKLNPLHLAGQKKDQIEINKKLKSGEIVPTDDYFADLL